jgi:phage tail-like protein
MSCLPSDRRFRLLDHFVGWDAESHDRLAGLDDDGGLRLAGGPDGIAAEALDAWISPPPLASGCGPCDWLLAARPAPESRVLRLDGCSNRWRPAWPRGCAPARFRRVVAVARDGDLVAVADAGEARIWVLRAGGGQIVAEIAIRDPRDLSFGPGGQIVAAAEDGAALLRFAPGGRPLGPWPAALPSSPIARLAHDRAGRLWLAVEAGTGRYALHAQESLRDAAFRPKTVEDLAAAFARTAALRSGREGFCLHRGAADGAEAALCWDWFGRPMVADCVDGAAGADFVRQGQLLTRALDSGIPRCRWHRLVVDAEIPDGTRASLAVATSEDPASAPQGAPDPDWPGFPAGLPHPGDWQIIEPGQLDALIRCPPGRHLFVRVRLSGDGRATPRVRRIHIDFPRTTSADLLPALYRDEGVAGDFTERFLALFDASLETVDTAVARFPALIDGARARAEVLPWIARFLAISLDETWDTETRRAILKAGPDLFRRRGTREGLIRSIRLAFNLAEDPVVPEHGLERLWGALGAAGRPARSDARLGLTRLFSRKSARLTLGASPLGRTPVMSYGDPAADPHATGAFRFTVAVPAREGVDRDALARLVEGQKPAHTLATLAPAAAGAFRLGGAVRLGVDTLLAGPGPLVLGPSGGRLGRGAMLGGAPPPGPVLGVSARTGAPPLAQPLCSPE